MAELTPGLELPNGGRPTNYPQDFVRYPNPNKPGPCNHKAEKAPAASAVYKGVYHK